MIRLTAGLGLALVCAAVGSAQEREAKVRRDRRQVEEDGHWIYNDLARGFAEAKESSRPLLVTLRCIPCEACAQLDAQIVNRDPVVRSLLDRFVCVRIVQANGLDLSLFQYDYDQSYAAFFLNADGTIYGRYGTRSHETESERDVSVAGFARALEGALELHAQFPGNRAQLAAKRGPRPPVTAPEEFPSLKGRYGPKLDEAGNVVKSCIHCHQVGEAQRHDFRDRNEPIPEQALYPYPLPAVLGLTMDPRERATILEVAPDASAAQDGFLAGDAIRTLAGQPLLSIADFQWVLHHAAEQPSLTAVVDRDGQTVDLTLSLPRGWRRRGDLSWRATSWELRRMTTGGLVLENPPAAELAPLGLTQKGLALRVKYVGQYDEHAAGKNAGFQKGDVLIEADGRKEPLTESQWMTWLVNARRRGDRVPVVVLRDGQRVKLNLPIQ